jgi:hypothetical protein
MAHLPAELRAQLLEGDWDAFEGAAFPGFGGVHLVDSFPLGSSFDRFEAADYGLNGTAWLLVGVDYDGEPGVCGFAVREGLAARSGLRARGGGSRGGLGDAVGGVHGPGGVASDRRPEPVGCAGHVGDEFSDGRVHLVPGNNDPRAGFMRLRTLMERDPEHPFPKWHPRRSEKGAPRLFVVRRRCPQLVEQIKSAPLQPLDKRDGGEMIDPVWESRSGHAVAAARYAVLSRPIPSEKPEDEITEPRAALH